MLLKVKGHNEGGLEGRSGGVGGGWGCHQPQEVSLTVRSSSITLLPLSFALCSRDLRDKNTKNEEIYYFTKKLYHYLIIK